MAPATRRAIRDATNLLTATPDEAAIIIACALANPKTCCASPVPAGASRSSAYRRTALLQPAAEAPQQQRSRR